MVQPNLGMAMIFFFIVFGMLYISGLNLRIIFGGAISVMTIGIMPIAGITLPFMSYGGSSILTNLISLGLIIGK